MAHIALISLRTAARGATLLLIEISAVCHADQSRIINIYSKQNIIAIVCKLDIVVQSILG